MKQDNENVAHIDSIVKEIEIIVKFAGKGIDQGSITMQRTSDLGVLRPKWCVCITIQPKVHESSQKYCKGQSQWVNIQIQFPRHSRTVHM